jgi:hypothetical protein
LEAGRGPILRGTALVGNGYGCNIGGLGGSAYVASISLGDIALVLRFLHELEASRYEVGYLRSIKPQNHQVSLYSSMRLTPITNPVPSRIPESSWGCPSIPYCMPSITCPSRPIAWPHREVCIPRRSGPVLTPSISVSRAAATSPAQRKWLPPPVSAPRVSAASKAGTRWPPSPLVTCSCSCFGQCRPSVMERRRRDVGLSYSVEGGTGWVSSPVAESEGGRLSEGLRARTSSILAGERS